MYKFLFVCSVLVFILGLALFIKSVIGEFDWAPFVVAVLTMITAVLTMWTSKILQKLKNEHEN